MEFFHISIVFLGGAVFVFLVINISRQSIRQIRESQQEVLQMHTELKNAYESTVEGWGRALELRDNERDGETPDACQETSFGYCVFTARS